MSNERGMVSADEARAVIELHDTLGADDIAAQAPALARTVIALHAIVEGRTVPPTDDERAVDVLRAAAVAAGHPAADGDPDAQLCAVRAQAFREGAETMRGAVVQDPHMILSDYDEARIRALPVPPCPEVSR